MSETIQKPTEAAFEMFADAYPHEAAKVDWQAFVKYVQKRKPVIQEAEIRRLLDETEEQPHA